MEKPSGSLSGDGETSRSSPGEGSLSGSSSSKSSTGSDSGHNSASSAPRDRAAFDDLITVASSLRYSPTPGRGLNFRTPLTFPDTSSQVGVEDRSPAAPVGQAGGDDTSHEGQGQRQRKRKRQRQRQRKRKRKRKGQGQGQGQRQGQRQGRGQDLRRLDPDLNKTKNIVSMLWSFVENVIPNENLERIRNVMNLDTKVSMSLSRSSTVHIDRRRAEDAGSIFLNVALNHNLLGFTLISENRDVRRNLGFARQASDLHSNCNCRQRCGPDSGCVNWCMRVECADECKFGDCGNKRVKNREWCRVYIAAAGEKGIGLYFAHPVKAGQLVVEYCGEVIGQSTFETRKEEYEKKGFEHYYFMHVKANQYIDATMYGSIARFANHSCNPNCKVEMWTSEGTERACIFTKRDVSAGDEVTYNYNWNGGRQSLGFGCLCGVCVLIRSST